MSHTQIEQAAHKAAMKEGRRFTTDHAQCRAYHEHMLAHLRPQIEAAAREAALREALESVRAEHLQDPPHDDPTDIAYDKAVTHCVQAISDLIEKEPTNAG